MRRIIKRKKKRGKGVCRIRASRDLDYSRYRLNFREWIALILKTGAVFLAAGYLFYDSLLVFAAFIPVLLLICYFEKRHRAKKRRQILVQQFKEAIILLYSFVATGSTLEQAFCRSCTELLRSFKEDDDIVREFYRIRTKLEMNVTIEECMEDFARRSGQEDIESFSQVVAIAKRSGGNMPQIIKNSVETIKNKIESENEIRTLLGAKTGEFKLMVMIPVAVMLYMRVFSPGFMEVLYKNPAGLVFMTCCLGVYGAAVSWGFKILDIHV